MKRQHSKKPIKNMKINKHKRPKRPHERLFTGIFTGNAKGFGFVTPDEGQLEDITGKDILLALIFTAAAAGVVAVDFILR